MRLFVCIPVVGSRETKSVDELACKNYPKHVHKFENYTQIVQILRNRSRFLVFICTWQSSLFFAFGRQSKMGPPRCPGCKSKNVEGYKFCSECGQKSDESAKSGGSSTVYHFVVMVCLCHFLKIYLRLMYFINCEGKWWCWKKCYHNSVR